MRRLFCALCVTLAVGCGGKGDISGKVTFKDKTVSSGTVMVVASDSMPYHGNIQEDGTYEIKGVPTGKAKFGVSSPDPRGDKEGPKRGRGAIDLAAKVTDRPIEKTAPPSADAKNWFPIPDQYGNHETSGISHDVTRGANKVDIPLK